MPGIPVPETDGTATRIYPMSTTPGHSPFPWATTGRTMKARTMTATVWEILLTA